VIDVRVEHSKGTACELWDIWRDSKWLGRIELQRSAHETALLTRLALVLDRVAQHAGDLDATLAALTLLREG
jgi:hypothetical protein